MMETFTSQVSMKVSTTLKPSTKSFLFSFFSWNCKSSFHEGFRYTETASSVSRKVADTETNLLNVSCRFPSWIFKLSFQKFPLFWNQKFPYQFPFMKLRNLGFQNGFRYWNQFIKRFLYVSFLNLQVKFPEVSFISLLQYLKWKRNS